MFLGPKAAGLFPSHRAACAHLRLKFYLSLIKDSWGRDEPPWGTLRTWDSSPGSGFGHVGKEWWSEYNREFCSVQETFGKARRSHWRGYP